MTFKTLLKVLSAGCIVSVLIQFVPFNRKNPPVTAAISAPPEVLNIFKRSCFDCHSNETRWPWYSRIAPVSWLVGSDVREGRENMNFSDWNNLSADDQLFYKKTILKKITEDEMPLFIYKLGHPDARLSDGDKEIIQKWVLSK
jgi:hypothetical protein